MSITIRVNGTEYDKFESAQCTIQLDALSNSFEIDVITTNGAALPFKMGDACEFYVNGVKKVTGTIEICEGDYNATNHSIRYSGRDKTAALVDSTLGKLSDIKPPISLKAICQSIISHIGASIAVIDNSTSSLFNDAEDLITPEVGQNCYEFLEALAAKRQVLLSSNADGNLVLTKSKETASGGRLQNQLNDNGNNILSASFSFNNTERFYKYEAVAQLNPIALNNGGETDLDPVVNQSGGVTDNEMVAGRQYIFKPAKSSSSEECKLRAEWELNMRKARSKEYTVEVNGHTIGTGKDEVWDINTLVPITDVFAGITAKMLLNKVVFRTSLDQADQSSLSFVPEGSYTTQISEPRSSTNKVGEGFTTFP